MCSDALVNISISDVGLSGETRQKAHTLIFFGTGTGQSHAHCVRSRLPPKGWGLEVKVAYLGCELTSMTWPSAALAAQ